ncbi:HD domain-containing protein [candidate division FCPU426 bacterium]|nr:HD domain-containing protein [candidate division FCPU426 bacterium]
MRKKTIPVHAKKHSAGKKPAPVKPKSRQTDSRKSHAPLGLSSQNKIIKLINSSLNIDEVLNLSMKLMEKTLNATASSILLYDAETNELKFYLATGSKKDILKVIRMPADKGVAGRSFLTGRTLLIPDASKSPFFYKQVDDTTKFVTKNLIATPIPIKGKRIGVLEVLNKANGTFTKQDMQKLKNMANEISVAIDNARLYDEVKSAYIVSMLNMAQAEKFRDIDTGLHIERCGEYALHLAPDLGIPQKDFDNLRVSMMMHDIGKVAIPDAILLKPGRLNDEEMTVMKTHTTKGGQILGQAPLLQLAVDIATCHHEKWDGTGYPNRLKDESIPLPARMLAIIDVFDALLSKRPYKDPFPPEKVKEILLEGKGTHFDPQVLDLFLQRYAEMCVIHSSMS